MYKLILIFISTLFALACRSEAKMSETSKMTPPDKSTEQFRLGIRISVHGLSDAEGVKVAKGFEDQLSAFEPCLKQTGKGEVVRLTASFKLAKRGLVEDIKITEVVPESPQFKACFLKQIEQLDLGRQPVGVGGELTLGTFYGGPSGWDQPHKKAK